jgi:DNA helicase-2/ATP-dependent DNA helicase PcrA
MPLWEIISDETSVKTLAGRTAKPIIEFVKVITAVKDRLADLLPSEVLKELMASSGYIQDLKNQGTDEAEDRIANIQELFSAILQFEETNEEPSIENFLATASLASDLDNLEAGQKAISLMTLHSAKGLEFPVVFLVGMEQGLLPYSRSLDDPAAIEEERRLCYVGITRAQERLYITHTRQRQLWGYAQPAMKSQFLAELPAELLTSKIKTKTASGTKVGTPKSVKIADNENWKIGDRLLHPTFGIGEITHLFGTGKKLSIAVKFTAAGQKIIDPKIAKVRRLGE